MRSGKKYYIAAWILAVVIFNTIVFLLPDAILKPGEQRFWAVYITVMVGFIGQFICCMIYTSKQRKKERFLLLPIVYISYSALLVTFLVALQAVVFHFLPDGLTIIIAVFVLVFYSFSIVRSLAAADIVMDMEKRIAEQTKRIYIMTTKAKVLEGVAGKELQELVKNIHEELRFSDPVSIAELISTEEQLQTVFDRFATAVRENRAEDAKKEGSTLCALLKERNELCKRYK